ncbi:MAG: transposase [Acidimicrobiales bacterium]
MPFLEFPPELRRVVYTTTAIESLNARFRRAVRHRWHFPNEQPAMKVLYLVATSRKRNRENMTGKAQLLEDHPQHTERPPRRPHRRPHPMSTITTTHTENLTDPSGSRRHILCRIRSSYCGGGPLRVLLRRLWWRRCGSCARRYCRIVELRVDMHCLERDVGNE